MKGRRIKLINGYEWDAITAKKCYCYLGQPGVSSAIKRRIRRRERHNWKREGLDEPIR